MDELEPTDGTLRTYLQVVGRRFLWLLSVTVLCVAGAVAYSAVQKKEYSASAQLLVQPASGSVPISGTQPTISTAGPATRSHVWSTRPTS